MTLQQMTDKEHTFSFSQSILSNLFLEQILSAAPHFPG